MLSHPCRVFARFVLGASLASVAVAAHAFGSNTRSIRVSSADSSGLQWIRTDLPKSSGAASAWVLEPGANSGALHRVAQQGAVLERIKFKVSALEDGFAPLMSWGALSIALSHQAGAWTLWVTQGDDEWQAAGFQIEGLLNEEWIHLDLVQTSHESLVFLNGALAAAVPVSPSSLKLNAATGALTYYQLPFARLEIAEVAESTAYPGYVVKALRQSGLRETDIAAALNAPLEEVEGVRQRKETRDDDERRLMAYYPDFRVDVFAGDLSFEEEAWFLTQTVNREYYEYSSDFDLEAGAANVPLLHLLGADYLPTMEGRSWSGPIKHKEWGDYYIERIRGYIVPPADGDYRFWLSGDERAALFVSLTAVEHEANLVALLESPVPAGAWPVEGQSAPLQLTAGQPIYFELWHVELEGDDHVAIAWTTPDGQEPDIIPSAVITSYASGMPGSYPRQLYPKDPSLLGAAVESLLPEETRLEFLTIHANGQLLGNMPINVMDFITNNNRWHAYHGNGYGWMYSNSGSYPSIWVDDYTTWVSYEPFTANPQQFYHYDVDTWANYWANCSGIDCGELQFFPDIKPLHATFDTGGYGRWAEAANGDTINWIRGMNGTPSANTGPLVDNTNKTAFGRFLYFETSTGYAYNSGDTADLLAPPVAIGPAGSSLTLFYHMYGADIGSLEVLQRVNGAWITVWSKSGQQQSQQADAYRRADVSLIGQPGDITWVKIRATAVGGFEGNIAIDDIAIYDDGVDSDGDGMTDGWEWKIFQSFNKYVPGDSDSDGLPNMAEYILGANPTSWTQKNGTGAPSLLVF